MTDADLNFLHPPALVRVSAFTPAQLAQLGVPRGLIPYRPTSDPAADPAEVPEAIAESPLSGPALPPPTLGLGPRTRYRFQAHHADSAIVPPSNLTSDPATARRAGAVRKPRTLSTLARAASILLVGAAAAIAGYFFARPPVDPTSATGSVDGRGWTRSEARKLDAILAAERAGQPREMRDLVNKLAAARPGLAKLDLLRSRAAVLQKSFSEAEVDLNQAAREAQADQAGIAMARATHFARQRRLPEIRTWLTEAITRDPTRAEFYFQLAEANRRMGRTEEAVTSYQQARVLARQGLVPSPETIEFQRRLLLIESGREAEIDANAYRTELAKESPPPDWMLIAAAVALQRHDGATAARWLRAARQAMPPTDYVARVDDYAFRNHIDDPGLRELFPTVDERARAHLLAPPMLADP